EHRAPAGAPPRGHPEDRSPAGGRVLDGPRRRAAKRGAMTTEIVGREGELAGILDFLAGSAPGALLLEGDAGIGKATLWRARARLASVRGYTVLSCRPASHETPLSFAGLADLVAPVLDTLRADLPGPQRRALEVALLLRDPSGPPPDERAVGAAVTS